MLAGYLCEEQLKQTLKKMKYFFVNSQLSLEAGRHKERRAKAGIRANALAAAGFTVTTEEEIDHYSSFFG